MLLYDAPISITCTGTEDSIMECNLGYYKGEFCTGIVAALCEGEFRWTVPVCIMPLYFIERVRCKNNTDTIRLTKYSSNTRGRLEVCFDDSWGTVCGKGATLDTIATVVCRELNHSADGWCVIL